jgi:hypothetical protein
MSQIVRVETFAGIGPYRQGGPIGPSPVCVKWQHPTPEDDVSLSWHWDKLQPRKEWFFGFEDMNQLLEWFPREDWRSFFEFNDIRKDVEHQCGISTYVADSEDIILGDKQAIFRLERAERVNFEPFKRNNIARNIINAIAGPVMSLKSR